MKKSKVFIIVLFLYASFSVNAQYQNITFNLGNSVVKAGQKTSFTCLGTKNSYTTPETVLAPDISYEVLKPEYIPNSSILTVLMNSIIISDYIDAELKVKITCKVGDQTDSKILTILPSKYTLDATKYAFLFIHGLGGSHTTWDDLTTHLDNYDPRFQYCSNYKVSSFNDAKLSTLNKCQNASGKIPLFTMDFSDNQNLTFTEQGEEVNAVIQKIISDFGDRKIILFAHSMGGLAARAYIMNYGHEKIGGLVTAATPHSGSLLAYFAPEGVHVKVPKTDIYADAKAIQYLEPGSKELTELGRQQFPYEIPIVTTNSILESNPVENEISDIINKHFLGGVIKNIKSSSCLLKTNKIPDFLNERGSDGVVPFISQLINSNIANSQLICPKVFITNKRHRKVTKDIQYMEYSLNAIINSIKERENAKPLNNNKNFLGFILDSSGSMKTNDPNGIRKTAVNQILDLLKGDEDVFIVDFDDKANWRNENHWRNWDLATLKGFVNSVNSAGGTNLGAGLETMKNALEGNISSNAFGGILMFTDGIGDYNNEAAWFQQNNIPVHTISYTSQADAKTMNKIAQATGGIYLQANNEQDVIAALSDYFNNIVGYNKICSYANQINQNQTLWHTLHLDYFTEEAVYNLSWTGSKIGLKLIAPDGTVYKENQLGEWFTGNNYTSVKIKRPQGGEWKAEFTGIQIPQGGEPFSFEVSGDTPSKFNLKNQNLPSGQLMFNLAEENNAIDITSIIPEIIIETPRNKKMNVSANYNKGSFSFLPYDGEGNYNISISFKAIDKQGNTIQRQFRKSVLVGNDVPSFIASVEHIMGNVITAPLGKWNGNQEGIKCYIYDSTKTKADAKAIGVVKFVRDNYCQINISEFLGGNNSVQIGDIVELDFIQWQNDKN